MQRLIQPLYTWYRQGIRNSKYRWWIILGSLLYLVGPIDISPDIFPIVGWIDDSVVATVLITEVSQLLIAHLNNRKNKPMASFHPKSDPVFDLASEATVVDVKAVSVS